MKMILEKNLYQERKNKKENLSKNKKINIFKLQ